MSHLFGFAFHGQLLPPPVKEVFVGEDVGRGLVATRNITRGEIIFTEAAAVSVLEDNGVPGCGFCGCSLAGVDASPILGQLDHPELFPSAPPVVKCNSCSEKYCSEHCRDKAESLFHRRLCAGCDRRPEGALEGYSVYLAGQSQHTKLVIGMAMKLAAMMLQEWDRNGHDVSSACAPFLRWTANRGLAEPLEVDAVVVHMHAVRVLSMDAEERAWLDVTMIETLLAMVCLNSIEVRMRSPFPDYFSALKRLSTQDKDRAIERMLQLSDGPASRADAFFHGLCGTRGGAMFALHACLNHSCQPVAEVRCGGFVSHSIDVGAVENIAANSPITISYVAPNLSWYRRCEILQSNYGFICACACGCGLRVDVWSRLMCWLMVLYIWTMVDERFNLWVGNAVWSVIICIRARGIHSILLHVWRRAIVSNAVGGQRRLRGRSKPPVLNRLVLVVVFKGLIV